MATHAPCRRSPRGAPASRTRARSWSPWRWPTHLSRAATSCWLDLCAGPGGKAALLAALAAERGAKVVASERLPQRAGLVRRTLATDGGFVPGVVGVVAADGTLAPYRAGIFDRVLVDAPCTGLGALRRRPEARWRRKPDDLLALVMLQRQLVRAALDLVRPGGVVLYATCSPVISETSTWSPRCKAPASTPTLEDLGPQFAGVPDSDGPVPGTVQLWPHRHGTDAMFMALFRRVLASRGRGAGSAGRRRGRPVQCWTSSSSLPRRTRE